MTWWNPWFWFLFFIDYSNNLMQNGRSGSQKGGGRLVRLCWQGKRCGCLAWGNGDADSGWTQKKTCRTWTSVWWKDIDQGLLTGLWLQHMGRWRYIHWVEEGRWRSLREKDRDWHSGSPRTLSKLYLLWGKSARDGVEVKGGWEVASNSNDPPCR